MPKRKKDFKEVIYKGKTYLYTYEELQDDADMLDDDKFDMGTDEKLFDLEIYDEKEKLLLNIEIEADAILEVTDEEVIEVIKKRKL